MAILHRAQLTPSKMELLAAWVPLQPWCGTYGDLRTLDAVGAYRFDDPQGEVGIETHLLRSEDGQVFQVPLTYRGAPLDGAGASLITTMQHSVLGERWVYDACGDPTYAQALATAILAGGTQADLDVVTDGGYERREATTKVAGSGLPGSAVPRVGQVAHRDEGKATIIRSGNLEMTVFRVIHERSTGSIPGVSVLTGTWPGQGTPAHLASARST